MNDWCFRPQFCTVRLYWSGYNLGWWNEMNFIRSHASGGGSIARPIDLQSSALPLCYAPPLPTSVYTTAQCTRKTTKLRPPLPLPRPWPGAGKERVWRWASPDRLIRRCLSRSRPHRRRHRIPRRSVSAHASMERGSGRWECYDSCNKWNDCCFRSRFYTHCEAVLGWERIGLMR